MRENMRRLLLMRDLGNELERGRPKREWQKIKV
jgi:hypothetical protein